MVALPRGRLVWLEFDPAAGHEQKGRRPAVIVSPLSYNERSSLCLVCPVTGSARPWAWKIPFETRGLISGWILVDQIRSIDSAARHVVDTGYDLEKDDLDALLVTLARLTS